MITSEQELLFVEQHTVPPRMPRGRDDQKVRTEWHRLGPFKDNFGIRLGGKLGAVDDTLGCEMSSIFGCIGNVIPMCEKNPRQPTHGLELPHERGQEFWGIDQPIAIGMLHEITVATV
jgi:hypothetical protein